MDISLSTQLSQSALSDQVGTAMTKKGLEAQQIEGQNILALLASAAPSFTDPSLGAQVDIKA